MQRWLFDITVAAVDAWFVAQCADPAARMHLYYLPSTETQAGQIGIATDAPSEAHLLASNSPVSCAWSKDQARIWVRERLNALPIIGPGV